MPPPPRKWLVEYYIKSLVQDKDDDHTSKINLIMDTRRSQNRLIFAMGIPILVRRHFYIQSDPGDESVAISDAYLQQKNGLSLIYVMTCRLFRGSPVSMIDKTLQNIHSGVWFIYTLLKQSFAGLSVYLTLIDGIFCCHFFHQWVYSLLRKTNFMGKYIPVGEDH